MNILVFLSQAAIPILIVAILTAGFLKKQNIYDEFVEGAADGIKTAVKILPTLVGLMVSVGVLRASGFLDAVCGLMQGLAERIHFPSELIPLVIVRLFSNSAATGLLLDLYREYGTDSFLGLTASIMMSSTETVFYTMSVYFMAAKVTKTRWTLPGALIATFAGVAASVVIAQISIASI